jgi:hypothetical protein
VVRTEPVGVVDGEQLREPQAAQAGTFPLNES